jgi:hypothetical protein
MNILLDEDLKKFVKTKLRLEAIALFKIYAAIPLLDDEV